MKIYRLTKDGLFVTDKTQFNPTHILECGQVFCYRKIDNNYEVFPQDKFALIEEKSNGFLIKTDEPEFFVNYFDLNTDYSALKKQLSQNILKKPIQFGYGIRILKQDLFETLISFIISSNNNIKRIQLILTNLRKSLGNKTKFGYSFPTQKKMLTVGQDFFLKIGAGYRAKYLYNVLRQVDEKTLMSWSNLPTAELRKNLISLSGVGPKVADCILLFGYGKNDVFPVDTWIEQMYNQHFPHEKNREKIRENLVKQFGSLSGLAQQYLFYFQRLGEP